MKEQNLREGSIFLGLSRLALPIMLTSFIQMAYNLVDMIWIGRIGSGAMAAVGAAGIYLWISDSLTSVARMGGQIKVAHAIGAGEEEKAKSYATAAFQLGLLIVLLYMAVLVIFHKGLIGFFRLGKAEVSHSAEAYLLITGTAGILFGTLNQIFTGICTGRGNSKLPFVVTSAGLVLNVILDPVLIFGLGPFPELGVVGAAAATAGSQGVVTLLFLVFLLKDQGFFRELAVFRKPDSAAWKEVSSLGLPAGIQNVFMSGLSLLISRIVSSFGADAIAVQRVGGQVESISWMISGGFGIALNAFVGQNFGARLMGRVQKGYRTALGLMAGWGVFCTLLLLVFPQQIFGLFLHEAELLPMGVDYLRILGLCQFFSCIEGAATGAFNGLGETKIPSGASIFFNVARVPFAMLLSSPVFSLGLNGVWWALTIASIIKGTLVTCWYSLYVRRKKLYAPAAE